MLPLRDDQPRYSFPFVNTFLITLNAIVFFFEVSVGPHGIDAVSQVFGVVPSHLGMALAGSPRYPLPAVLLTFFTSMFVHGGLMHIIGNMWFLYIFGDNVEDYLGHFSYLLFYVLAGLIAMSTQVAIYPHSNIPTVGASGAIAGVLGAYFVVYPRARVLTWLPPIFFFHLPAWGMLGYWFVFQFIAGAQMLSVASSKDVGGVAVWAHVGGFLAGVVMVKIFPERKRRYPYALR